jgi:hypothetical protein
MLGEASVANHPVACLDQVTRQRAAATTEFENETLSSANGFQHHEDAGRAGIGVEAVAEVVHECKIVPVVRGSRDARDDTRCAGRLAGGVRTLCRECARVTGVAFFDFFHGQTGVAPNAIELHPVLRFR